MKAVLFILVVLYVLKVLWNFVVPYDLSVRSTKPDFEKSSGISLSPHIEFILLAIVVSVSAFSGEALGFVSYKYLAAYGFLAIRISYVHIFIGGIIAHYLIEPLIKRKK